MNRGQVLLITLLVLTVATTIALSLIGRATIDLSLSNQLEESTRAFNAAEAGVEQALKSGTGTAGAATLSSGVTYTVSVNAVGGASGVFAMAHRTVQNTTETLWLAQHDDATGVLLETPFFTASSMELCWSKEVSPSPPAALEAGVLYKESTDGSYKMVRAAFDPQAATRSNNFDSTGITANGCGLGYYGKQLNFSALGINPLSDTLLSLRIKPYYADVTIAADAGAQILPKQGNHIESVGRTGTGVTRKVVVFQQYRTPLSVFDSVIFSQSLFGH